ncbi:hypothetical protein [Spiroplasma chrysopicola]|uniref:Uncharacterized protein n=1 Tax=Spiroplasma chrysopicola DF-1 TaxID=1276227 RepID=R4UHB8_9MOLU|nr:hypothetical protein [Spiroplasma chrysopicola]AGM25565.1 hypothetical protein SCHRY_v1c09930 [Spiroplasma chrysopicola DF-1]
MKKILNLLAIASLVSTSPTVVMNLSNNINQEINQEISNENYEALLAPKAASYIWENVKIEHSVSVSPSGTHQDDSYREDFKATAKLSFEEFRTIDYVVAEGSFVWHTHKEPREGDSILLRKTIDNEGTIKWESTLDENTHDKWSGWGHQTCKIHLTITAIENDEGIIELTASSWIFVRTAGSINSPYTNSVITKFKFE